MTDKELFVSLLTAAAGKRQGFRDFMEWLEECTDFFEAPASAKHHGASAGMLLRHSLNVYERMRKRFSDCEARGIKMDAVIVVSLLHDVCKANFYEKKEDGYGYVKDLALPVGHGERSVIMIQQQMTLTYEEIIVIRWHMGAFDDAAKGGSRTLSEVFNRHPLALMLHLADMEAAYLDETEEQTCRKE